MGRYYAQRPHVRCSTESTECFLVVLLSRQRSAAVSLDMLAERQREFQWVVGLMWRAVQGLPTSVQDKAAEGLCL